MQLFMLKTNKLHLNTLLSELYLKKIKNKCLQITHNYPFQNIYTIQFAVVAYSGLLTY